MLGFCQERDRDDTFNMSDVSETSRPLDDHLHGQNQTSHKASFFARKLKQMPREAITHFFPDNKALPLRSIILEMA